MFNLTEFIMNVLKDVEAMCALTCWMASCNGEYAWRLDDILDMADEEGKRTRAILCEDVGRVPKGWEKLLFDALKHIAHT